jgi:CheY-like chemotaxis protein
VSLDPILHAEDDENDVFFLERAFEKAGIRHPLVTVPSGDEAIAYLSGADPHAADGRRPPCLVLLDLKLPGTSGLDVLKWIRARPALCALPVLMLTSSSQDGDIHRAYLQGANGYLVKPCHPHELVTMAEAIRDFWLAHNRASPRWVGLQCDEEAQSP